MRLVIFEGSKEEFEAIRPLAEKDGDFAATGDLTAESEESENSEDSEPAEARYPTYEEAVTILRYHGGIPQGQKDLLRVLFDHDAPVRSSTIRNETGWSNARFRGVRANFPRRASGALGLNNVKWVERNWISEEGENEYTLPRTVRRALSDELGW